MSDWCSMHLKQRSKVAQIGSSLVQAWRTPYNNFPVAGVSGSAHVSREGGSWTYAATAITLTTHVLPGLGRLQLVSAGVVDLERARRLGRPPVVDGDMVRQPARGADARLRGRRALLD